MRLHLIRMYNKKSIGPKRSCKIILISNILYMTGEEDQQFFSSKQPP
jgi:hypothetical protein